MFQGFYSGCLLAYDIRHMMEPHGIDMSSAESFQELRLQGKRLSISKEVSVPGSVLLLRLFITLLQRRFCSKPILCCCAESSIICQFRFRPIIVTRPHVGVIQESSILAFQVQGREYRDQSYNGMFKIATFDEYIAVAQAADRTVGIYPETKVPHILNAYLAQFNTTFENLLIRKLEQHGYNSARSPCFVQSFNLESLQYLAERTKVRLVYLMETEVTDELLSSMTSYIAGIGTWKQAIVEVDHTANRIIRTTDFMERVKKHGYVVRRPIVCYLRIM